MTNYTVHHGDVVKWCNEYDGPDLFSAVLTDPPYHLTSIVNRFGKSNSKPAKHGRDGAFGRVSKGFMGMTWDGGTVAFDPATWHAISKVMHPGAFGMAAAGSRGYHRMAVAIENSLLGNTTDSIVMQRRDLLNISKLLELAIESEDWDLVVEAKDFIDHLYRIKTAAQQAGFIIHPAICWTFCSGFPKGTRIDTQIDEAAGVKIDRGYSFNMKGSANHPEQALWDEHDNIRPSAHHEAQTEMAQAWSGHRYGLQALKPAAEFYCVFQKAYPGGKVKPYQSIVSTGAGALNIDAAWVENGGEGWSRNNAAGQNGNFNASGGEVESDGGRWPPNLIMDESYVEWAGVSPERLKNFYITDWMLERLEDADPLVFAAKASIAEREAGLDPMQRRLMREMYSGNYELDGVDPGDGVAYGKYNGKSGGVSLAKSNRPGRQVYGHYDDIEKGVINDGIEAVSDRPYLRNQTERYNIHPTIKPLSLCEYLARLLAPPDLYKESSKIFVPFAGAGSEMAGIIISGKWGEVVGVELEEKHIKIANARLPFWSKMREQYGDRVLEMVRLSMKGHGRKNKKADHEQAEMF